MRPRSRRLPGEPSSETVRALQKQRTHAALLQAALELLDEQGFSGLSLREVTRRAGVVPTAFYRHFGSLEELGLALVDESFRTLREMLREARTDTAPGNIIERSVETLVRHVDQHRLHFRFIAREQAGGVPVLRQAIRRELRLFTSELATDLARLPILRDWSTEDLHMIAGLMVTAMVATAEALLEVPSGSPRARQEVVRNAERQLRLIVLAIPHWRSAR